MIILIIALVVAYLYGSLCSAILVAKLLDLKDPRTTGSKNPGATNMLRIGGKQAAIITLVGDVLKGLIPVLIAKWIGLENFPLSLVALAAFLGHLFPVFFGFKGGKGVATSVGVYFGLSFLIGGGALVAWLTTVVLSKYSSLGALISTLVAVVLALFTQPYYFIAISIMAGFIIWKHWGNIERLKAGTESKVDWI